MGKLITYNIIMVGLVGLFYFTGLLTDCKNADGTACVGDEECMCIGRTPNSIILNLILKPANWQPTGSNVDITFFSKALLLLEGITALALSVITALALRDARLALVGPFAIYLFNLLWDFIALITKVNSIHPLLAVVVSLTLLPLLIPYTISVVEWWGSGS